MQSIVDREGKLDSDCSMQQATPSSDTITPTMIKQVGALPVVCDTNGLWKVTLITTRDSGRWSIPKGNPIKGLTKAESAAMEAYEEGGFVGKMQRRPIGSYLFWKRRSGHWELAEVDVYLMKIESYATDFKEKGLRNIQTFHFDDADDAIVEPGLKALLKVANEKLNHSTRSSRL
jgi:8-oxo-dGTP pyrophosphatase MutT (NUDIX family)